MPEDVLSNFWVWKGRQNLSSEDTKWRVLSIVLWIRFNCSICYHSNDMFLCWGRNTGCRNSQRCLFILQAAQHCSVLFLKMFKRSKQISNKESQVTNSTEKTILCLQKVAGWMNLKKSNLRLMGIYGLISQWQQDFLLHYDLLFAGSIFFSSICHPPKTALKG